MPKFDVNILSTGSKGNCVVIDDRIMCDAGIPKKHVEDEGYDLSHLEVLLVSHKHADHTNLPMIRWAIKNGVEVHLPESIIEMLQKEGRLNIDGYLHQNLFIHEEQQHYDMHLQPVDDLEALDVHVMMHPQRHHDIINYAFVFEKTINGELQRLLYSTDLDTIGPTDIGPGLVDLGMFDTIILEGNYDEIWLRDYIQISIDTVDDTIDTTTMTDIDLDHWVRENYRQMPKEMAAGLFRAVQNMRHLSKQQARLYVRNHLLRGGEYYEVHRSSMFYERPTDWDRLF